MISETRMKSAPAIRNFLLAPPSASGLIYDLPLMIERARAAKKILKDQKLLLAVKAFPKMEGLAKLAPELDGFDISNFTEYALIKDTLDKKSSVLSITQCPLDDLRKILSAEKKCTLWYNVGSLSEMAALIKLKEHSPFKLSLRVNTSSLLPKDHPLYYPSRFGLEGAEIERALAKFGDAIEGIHLHHGSERNDSDLLDYFLSYLKGLKTKFPFLSNFNLGGGWNISDHNFLSKIASTHLNIILEPGRSFGQGLGYAFTRIHSIRKYQDGFLIEGSLSPQAHLRWSRISGFGFFPLGPGVGEKISGELYYGSQTCDEYDVIRLSGDKSFTIRVGDYVFFEGINLYSLSWNHEFNGITTPVYFLE
jgi:diaminopimelate decarboxylase